MTETISTNAIPRRLTIIAMLCLQTASSAAAQQNQDELKQGNLVQAQSISANDYAFTRTVRTQQVPNGKTEHRITFEKFDPTKPADARWMFVSVEQKSVMRDSGL